MAVKRKPKAVGSILSGTLEAYHLKKKAEAYAAFPRWEELVGSEVAAVAYPEKILRRRILVVRVVDAVFAQDLSLQKEDLLKRVAALNAGVMFEDIRFVTGDPRTVENNRRGRKQTK